MRACGVCGEVASPGGAASPNQCLALLQGGVNGMCVWRVGEHELCFSDVGGSCGVVDHRVLGHFNWVRVFARITASVVLVSHSGASRAQRATSSSRQVVAVRRDPDILQADPRWGYDSGGGSVFESPLVAGWSYLEHLQIINSISTQFDDASFEIR